MKSKVLLASSLIAFFLINTLNSQEKLYYNKSQCALCNMIIKDKYFSAQAVSHRGETVSFDAIECLVNFLKMNNEINLKKLLVADYSNPDNFINASSATYLISTAIESPMGANLSAFRTKEAAIKIRKEKGGDLFDWSSLKEKFTDTKYGRANHEHHHDHYRPDSYAPIGIMGDHLHKKNGLMVSVRTMYMSMNGNRNGDELIDNSIIFNNYMVVPQYMDMEMYMVSAMYAPSDNLTLMLMQNIVYKRMDLKARMTMNGMEMFREFSTNSSDFGDMKLNALYGIFSKTKSTLLLNGGISIPLGAIQQRDDTPMMENVKLPYAMQLGSGTIDATFGATYNGKTASFSWGVQPLITLRTGKNSEDYRFGDQYQVNFWGAYKASKNISLSSRLLGITEKKINGIDTDLNPMMVTTANTVNSGYSKIKGYIGTNISFMQNSPLKKFRLGIEVGIPLYQDYNGIQMNEEFGVNIGLLYNIL